MPEFLTLFGASKIIDLAPSTLKGLIDRGKLEAIRDSAGRRLIPKRAAEKFAAERQRARDAAASAQ